ncbi:MULTISPECIES: TRAP transporter small permease [unclassified Sulfitobacter]|nr:MULTISPECIES: TRAP transporter small permease subunit [unclassified Sulfitobacter]KZX98863.1 C4-dicarboxylate ABC transporter permease [Sulfitobacter sp. HI0021]KZY01858.1 C4-dicarboxylate ABC transporter permease [Sulfitobacter sp. HI0027]KZZ03575.1 C4-dicarboxylate ABC transporter permease [Sulfitobacter sp. HI0076]
MSTYRSSMIRFSDTLDKVAMVLSGIAIVVLVGAVILQVVARYVFSQPPAYTEELARYAMIWAGLIGASMSFKRRFDPALFNGINRGPVWIKIGARLIKSVVVLIYLLPILWYVFFGPGMNPARGFLLRHSRTMADALPFSTVWVAIAVPLMIVFILVHLVARWSGDDRPAHTDADQ